MNDFKYTSRLCASLDVTSMERLLFLAEAVGPYVCMIKTHIDIISDFSLEGIEKLKALSRKYDFLIFEDRKFADIGKTVEAQCAGGVYKISEWADIINAHAISGEGVIDGLRSACRNFPHLKLLLIAQMSSKGNLITEQYTQDCLAMAERHSDFVLGFICQQQVSPKFLSITPGVHLDFAGGKLGQQYRTPEEALVRDRCDIIIVGSGIYEAKDPAEAAKKYHEQSWVLAEK